MQHIERITGWGSCTGRNDDSNNNTNGGNDDNTDINRNNGAVETTTMRTTRMEEATAIGTATREITKKSM